MNFQNDKTSFIITAAVAIGLCCSVLGCSLHQVARAQKKQKRQADIGNIYNRSAQSDEGIRNPVIVIPGILGSRLEDRESGQAVWGEINRKSVDPESAAGAAIAALPISGGVPLNQLIDGVVERGTVGTVKVRIAGIPVDQQAYGMILASLGVGGYVDEDAAGLVDYGNQHFTCFQFSYDWRRDNAENAALLHQFIEKKAQYVRQERIKRFGITDLPVKFDIVAHSMGGLIARYYLRYGDQPLSPDSPSPDLNWSGSANVERLIVVGTPSAGSVIAVTQLVDGYKVGPFLPTYQPAILGTMPSVYQLMPRQRHRTVVDHQQQSVPIFDIATWEKYGWGLLAANQDKYLKYLLPDIADARERRSIAKDHLRKCLEQANQFQNLLDVPADPPVGTTIHLIAGDSEQTDALLEVSEKGEVTVTETAPGDGTVTRRSALMDERDVNAQQWSARLQTPVDWRSVNFFFAEHLDLTSNVEFTDNLLYLLLEAPRKHCPVPLQPH